MASEASNEPSERPSAGAGAWGASRLPRRPALSDEIAVQIRNSVMAGELRAGEFLRIDRVAHDLGVSPTPVREALKALSAEDLVRHEPHRGFVVCSISREDIADLFATQEHLAGELAARAALRVTATELIELDRLAEEVATRIAPASSGGDASVPLVEDLVEAEHRLHVEINRVAGSRKLSWLLGCASRYLPTRFFAADQQWGLAALDAHEALLAALRSHDAETARRAMAAHVADGRERLMAHLDDEGMWNDHDPADVA